MGRHTVLKVKQYLSFNQIRFPHSLALRSNPNKPCNCHHKMKQTLHNPCEAVPLQTAGQVQSLRNSAVVVLQMCNAVVKAM